MNISSTASYQSTLHCEEENDGKGKSKNCIISVLFYLEALYTVSSLSHDDKKSRKILIGGGEVMRLLKNVIRSLSTKAEIGLMYYENQILLLAFVSSVMIRSNICKSNFQGKDCRHYSTPSTKINERNENDNITFSKTCKKAHDGSAGRNQVHSTIATPTTNSSDENLDPSSVLSSILYFILSVCVLPVQRVPEEVSNSDNIPDDSCGRRESKVDLRDRKFRTDEMRNIQGDGESDRDRQFSTGIGGSRISEKDKPPGRPHLSKDAIPFHKMQEADGDRIVDAQAFADTSLEQISRWVECGDRTALMISIISLPFLSCQPLSLPLSPPLSPHLPLPLPLPTSLSLSSFRYSDDKLISTRAGESSECLHGDHRQGSHQTFGSKGSDSTVKMPLIDGMTNGQSHDMASTMFVKKYFPFVTPDSFHRDDETQIRTLVATSCRLKSFIEAKLKYIRLKGNVEISASKLCTDLVEATKCCARALSIAHDVIDNLMMVPQCVSLSTFQAVWDSIGSISGTITLHVYLRMLKLDLHIKFL